MATIIAGKVTFKDGEHTGALGGKLLRSTAAGVV
jgi:N-acyl-D-aspartate/D-glutamate deacylase